MKYPNTFVIPAKKNTRFIAHRGASALETENSNAAFALAGSRSYFGIETDFHVTGDGHLILTHDDTTGRLCKENLSVENSSYEALRKLRMIDKYTGKTRSDLCFPDLSDYADICVKYQKVPILECKNPMDSSAIEQAIAILKNCGALEKTVFISFCFENLQTIRKLLPSQPVQFLTDTIDEKLIALLKQEKIDLDIAYHALTSSWVDRLHEEKLLINCWTVDDPSDCLRLIDWGVDFITSNCCE
jgi:glycerophosphoryl diester phosphodiesterase